MAITLVQQKQASGSSNSISFSSVSSGAGHALTLLIGLTGATTTGLSVSDNASNNWTVQVAESNAGSSPSYAVAYVQGAAAVSTVNVSLPSGTTGAALLQEWSGVKTANALDTSVGNLSGGAVTSGNTGVFATGNADDVIVGGLATLSTRTLTVTTSGYTALTGTTGGGISIAGAYQIVSSTQASGSIAWTISASGAYGAGMVALEAIETLTRTVAPTAHLKATAHRATSPTVDLKRTNTRVTAPKAHLRRTLTRVVAPTATLGLTTSTITRTTAPTVHLFGTRTRIVAPTVDLFIPARLAMGTITASAPKGTLTGRVG